MLGHRWPSVEDAVLTQARKGVSFSLPTELEEQLASKLVSLVPRMEMARFGKNGVDVVNAAVRIARAATGHSTVWMEEGAYHGHSDWALTAPKDGGIVPMAGFRTRRFPRGDLQALREGMRDEARGPACVLLDPQPAHNPSPPKPGYFREIRSLCDEQGALLILDEMVTGFRLGWPGGVSTFGIDCDMWCGAKALGNGWPITCLLGKREYMTRIEQDVFYSTTFAGEAVSIAAAIACLDEMEKLAATNAVNETGAAIRDWYNETVKVFELSGLTRTIGYDSRPVFVWKDKSHEAAFTEGVGRGGMLFQGYINVMVAHERAWPEITGALTSGLEAVQAALPLPAA